MVFMTSFVYAADEAHEHGGDFSAFSLVQPLGITALSLVLLTFLTGLFRRKLKTRFMTIHKIIAWAAIAVALTHGTLVFILFD
jgi:hypothetical protein